MATAVVMPKQGQSVESCIIVSWRKKIGDVVAEGDILCEVETDKALVEVESPGAGTVLGLFFQEGDEVPVLVNIAAIGQPGEDATSLRPDGAKALEEMTKAVGGISVPQKEASVHSEAKPQAKPGISPRALNLAKRKGLDLATAQISGTGPAGRIIERDVLAALARVPKMTPLAKSMVAHGDFRSPIIGSGVSGRVMADDLAPKPGQPAAGDQLNSEPAIEKIPLKGVRKIIAGRMLESLQTTAQLTLNARADARAMLAFRQRLKQSPETLGLQKVTINDLVLFAVSRTLPQHPELNSLFLDDTIFRYRNIHLALAVDTPRGLMVPVIREADRLSLKKISQESRRLASACLEGAVTPDELTGGTFTISNLGGFGIESFTPVLNPPQVGILGVGNINLKPVEVEGEVAFIPHIGLSLTINHQVVDGAPAARFLQALAQGLAGLESYC